MDLRPTRASIRLRPPHWRTLRARHQNSCLSTTQQRFSKQRGSQIVEEEKQLGSCTDVVSRRAVERYNRFNGDLPGDRYVGKTRVHCGNRLCSPRTIKRELDKRHKLIERLFLWRAAREPTGQIQCAEFDRKTPMQGVNVLGNHRGKLATDGIKAKICWDAAGRMLKDNGASNAKRPQPRKIVRQIAEAFAEKEARLDRIGRVGANTLCTEFPIPHARLAESNASWGLSR